MLKPTHLLILPFIFFSCTHSKSNPDTSTIINDSSDIEAVKEDSVASSPVQDHQKIDLSVIDGSVRKPFDTLSIDFDLSKKKHEVVYKKEEQLYFFDSKSGDRMIFPDTGRIFQFVLSSDGNTLYYTVRDEESLILKRADLLEKKAKISSIRIFDIPFKDFVSGITGQGSRMEIIGSTLSIGHGMINEHYSFPSKVHIVSEPDSSYLIESIPPEYYQKGTEDYHTRIASVSEKLRLEKRGEHKELFLISDPDTIQISDIDGLYKVQDYDSEYEVESYESFNNMLFETVQFSPDGSKILYSYPCVLYDFLHGPMYLVNVNGENLKLLSIDGGFSRDHRPAWLADGTNIVFHRSAKDDSGGLCMTINSENDFMRIEEKVDQFEIR